MSDPKGKILGAKDTTRGPGIATRSKDATRGSWPYYWEQEALRNKCIASSNKCLTSSNKKLLGAPGLTTRSKKLLGTSASLLVTSALLVVTRSY